MSIKNIYSQICNIGSAHQNTVIKYLQDYRKARQQAQIRAEKLYPEVTEQEEKNTIRYYTESFSEKRQREDERYEQNKKIMKAREKYVDEQTEEEAASARKGIIDAESKFQEDISACVKNVLKELRDSVTVTLNPNFLNTLKIFYDYDIPMSRTEIESLLALSYQNTTALAAINKTLEKTESKYELKYKSLSDYEQELNSLMRMAKGVKYIPEEYQKEGTELFKNTMLTGVRPDLTTYEYGMVFDSFSLINHREEFMDAMRGIESSVKAFDEKNDLIALKPIKTDSSENGSTAEDEETTPAQINKISDDWGRKIGKEVAETYKAAKEGLEHYLSK